MDNTIKKILIYSGVILGLVLSGIGVYVYIIFKTFDSLGPCGFDDGPFRAARIAPIKVPDPVMEFGLSNHGKLSIVNRGDTVSPIIILTENEKVKWTLDADVRHTQGYEKCLFWEISNARVTEEGETIRLSFLAYWTFGGEGGSMQINRETGANTFCLSW